MGPNTVSVQYIDHRWSHFFRFNPVRSILWRRTVPDLTVKERDDACEFRPWELNGRRWWKDSEVEWYSGRILRSITDWALLFHSGGGWGVGNNLFPLRSRMVVVVVSCRRLRLKIDEVEVSGVSFHAKPSSQHGFGAASKWRRGAPVESQSWTLGGRMVISCSRIKRREVAQGQ